MIVGSGVDVIEIARIARVLSERAGRFERRVFTPNEIADCRRSGRPAIHYAIRFAAKEALMKAVGTGWAKGVRWVDIETQRAGGAGCPSGRAGELSLALHGVVARRAAELSGGRGGEVAVHLAIGRSRTHALATVLLEVPDR